MFSFLFCSICVSRISTLQFYPDQKSQSDNGHPFNTLRVYPSLLYFTIRSLIGLPTLFDINSNNLVVFELQSISILSDFFWRNPVQKVITNRILSLIYKLNVSIAQLITSSINIIILCNSPSSSSPSSTNSAPSSTHLTSPSINLTSPNSFISPNSEYRLISNLPFQQVSQGDGSFTFRVKFRKTNQDANHPTLKLQLDVYLDDFWDLAHDQQSCESKRKMAFKSFDLTVLPDGWSKPITSNLSQKKRSRVWFFTITDCKGKTDPFVNKGQYLETELTIKNVNNSHFSCEEGDLPRIYGVLTLMYIALLIYSVKRLSFLSRMEDLSIYFFINVAIALDLVSLALFYIHYLYYSWDGEGLLVLHILAQLSAFVSSFFITGILILVVQGWTITFDDLLKLEGQAPVGILVFMIQFMVVALNKLTDNNEDKYHQYYGWAGLVNVGIRIALTIWFVVLKEQLKKKVNNQIAIDFLNQIMMIGLLYFLSFPILVFVAEAFVVAYYRHRVITIGVIISQSLAILILSYVFTHKKSGYQKVSTKNKLIL